jgi:hypothetical protein
MIKLYDQYSPKAFKFLTIHYSSSFWYFIADILNVISLGHCLSGIKMHVDFRGQIVAIHFYSLDIAFFLKTQDLF